VNISSSYQLKWYFRKQISDKNKDTITVMRLKQLFYTMISSNKPKIFTTYEDAEFSCADDGYQHDDLINVIIQKNLNFSNDISNSLVVDEGNLKILSIIASMQWTKSINVIDFGGGGGMHYQICKNFLDSSVNLNWRVVETKAMVSAANRLANKSLKFFTDLNSARSSLDKVDLVFASSSLQYTQNPLSSLRSLIELDAPYLCISRTPLLNESTPIISLQTSKLADNGPGQLPKNHKNKIIRYPIIFESMQSVERIIMENYRIRYKIREYETFSLGNRTIDMFTYFAQKSN
jgi:putative methyltransferase (TIGR04325 family)